MFSISYLNEYLIYVINSTKKSTKIDAQQLLMKSYSMYPITRNHLLLGRFVCRSAPPSVGALGCYWQPLHTEALPSIRWQSGGRRLLLLAHICLYHPQIHCNTQVKGGSSQDMLLWSKQSCHRSKTIHVAYAYLFQKKIINFNLNQMKFY